MRNRFSWFIVSGIAVALVLAFGVSRFASSAPDGLERVAADKALDSGERAHDFAEGPFADYSTRGVGDPGLSTGVAGVIGVFVTFALAGGLVWITSRATRRKVTGDLPISPS